MFGGCEKMGNRDKSILMSYWQGELNVHWKILLQIMIGRDKGPIIDLHTQTNVDKWNGIVHSPLPAKMQTQRNMFMSKTS